MSFCGVVPAIVLTVAIGFAQQFPTGVLRSSPILSEAEVARMESVVAAHPDDLNTRTQLLNFYGTPAGNDENWSNRLRLLSWAIQYHPESAGNGLQQVYAGMPGPIFEQLKPLWVAQVHQHAEDYNVLRNASVFLASREAPQAPRGLFVGGTVAAAGLIRKVDPAYPPLARQARIQGTVRFNVTVGKDGSIQNMTLVSGHPLLVQAAQDALRQWVYKPTMLNGNPVEISTTVDINFTLSDSPPPPA